MTSTSPSQVSRTAADTVEVARELWPTPAEVSTVRLAGRRSAGTGRSTHAGDDPQARVTEFVFVPNATKPRMLVPAGSAAAATAVRRFNDAVRGPDRYGRWAISHALRLGLGQRLMRDRVRVTAPRDADSVEARLRELFGQDVVVGLGLGQVRANQKPVLHVMTPRGRELGFVKVGHTPAARELIREEADALGRVATLHLPGFEVPRVIAFEPWREMELLVLSPLTTSVRRRARWAELPAAETRTLALAAGTTTGQLVGSVFWDRLHEEAGQVVDPEITGGLLSALQVAATRYGSEGLTFGSWHGDWTTWNMHRAARTLRVWDWERFRIGVPLGFDGLHFQLNVLLGETRSLEAAADALRSSSPGVLAQLEVPENLYEATLFLYFIELCSRYALAAQGDAGAPLRPRVTWLLDVLAAHADRR
jgi:hypothetical protein